MVPTVPSIKKLSTGTRLVGIREYKQIPCDGPLLSWATCESGVGLRHLRELDVPVVVRTAPLALAMALMITLCHTPPGTRNLMTVRLPTRARTAALQRAAAGWSAAARDQNEAAMGSYLALLAVAAVCVMARSLGPRWTAASSLG